MRSPSPHIAESLRERTRAAMEQKRTLPCHLLDSWPQCVLLTKQDWNPPAPAAPNPAQGGKCLQSEKRPARWNLGGVRQPEEKGDLPGLRQLGRILLGNPQTQGQPGFPWRGKGDLYQG